MRFKTFTSVGIVIWRKNYSEADRLVTIFTKDRGKITFIAKSIRKLQSRKRGSLEIFSHIAFEATESSSLGLIIEVQTINNFKNLRTNLTKVSVAFFVVEIINKLIRDDEPHPELFDLTIRVLKDIEKGKDLKLVRETFIRESLVLLGFYPHGQTLSNPDQFLESIVERKVNSVAIGKKLLQ